MPQAYTYMFTKCHKNIHTCLQNATSIYIHVYKMPQKYTYMFTKCHKHVHTCLQNAINHSIHSNVSVYHSVMFPFIHFVCVQYQEKCLSAH